MISAPCSPAERTGTRRATPATVDGRPGIALWSDHGLRAALVCHIAHGRIVHYDVIAHPRRLALLDVRG